MLAGKQGRIRMIIAVTNSKGGVGKTTLAVHLAAWFQEQGARPGLVDADAQGASSLWLREASPATPTFRLTTPDELLDQLPPLARDFDPLVIDGPAGLSEVTRAILLVSDLALLPCGPSALDLRAVHEAVRVVQQAQRIRQGPPRLRLVPNKLQVNYRLTQELLGTVARLGLPAAGGLRLRQAYADAAGQGTFVWRLGPAAVPAGTEIRQLFEEITRDATETKLERRAVRD